MKRRTLAIAILAINLAGQDGGHQMGIVEAGRLFGPLARGRAVTTRRPTTALLDGVDNP
jgi:hypothetical protein